MKMNKLITISALLMMLMMIGACGDSDKALDMEGLKLGKSLTSMLGEATTLLGGITDLDSAKAALPKLTEMDSGLGDLVAKAKKLSPESLDSFKGMALKAVPSLEGAVAKLAEIPGVGQTVKPIVDSMMAKIKSL